MTATPSTADRWSGPTIAIVGPGRLGAALAKLWADAGLDVAGFVGRDLRADSVAAARRFVGRGAAWTVGDLVAADRVFLAVQDDVLASVVGAIVDALGASGVRRGSVWFHASGVHDVDVLAPLGERGAAIAALHPLCPVPSSAAGVQTLPGAPATLAVAAGARSGAARAALESLAAAAGLRVLAHRPDVDRAAYHAACALAANGVTALVGAVEEILAGMLEEPGSARDATRSLVSSALALCAELGPAAALSGPAVRGDAAVVARHRRALAALDEPDILAAYSGLMRVAVGLAERSGALESASSAALREVLSAVPSEGRSG